jgi:hypothetical protein
MSRLRLFLTKYATGLLFVVLQTTIIAAGSFLVFGLRAHQWRTSLFLLIPLVVLLFSYLFCVCVLLGVLTRSTIAAVLLTVLFWFICFGINWAELNLYKTKTALAAQTRTAQRQADRAEAELRELKASGSIANVFGIREAGIRKRRDKAQDLADESRRLGEQLGKWHRIAYGVATFIPKTGETVDLLDRKLFDDADLAAVREQQKESPFMASFEPERPAPPTTNPAELAAYAAEEARGREERRQLTAEAAEATYRAERSRSVPWILGTSLAFEAVIIAWGAWVFCRRDY